MGRIITASSDGTIKVWDTKDGRCGGTLFHSPQSRAGVMCVSQSGYRVASGAYDSTVNVYDLRKLGESAAAQSCLVRTLEAHSAAVFSVELHQDCLISGSADHTIRVFRFQASS
jgi:WD40 repeat protein